MNPDGAIDNGPAQGSAALVLSGGVEPVRVLSTRGVQTMFVAHGRTGPSSVSNAITRRFTAPDGWDHDFDRWFNSQSWPNGTVAIPGNDDAAWWVARRQERGEAGTLRLATPGFGPIRSILQKYRLAELCREHQVATPGTWLVEGGRVPAAARAAGFPLVVKPQSRVGLKHWTRGRLVRNDSELETAIHWFRQAVRFEERVIADDPLTVLPVVQEFVIRPGHEVYHLLGYRSRDGESVVAAHRKVLQYPLRFGSGLCFESAEVDTSAAAKLESLLAEIGFHGIFEAEYVERGGQKLLIDLNPRSYNGLSLETVRGYELPWYLYLDTIGERELLSAELASARALTPRDFVWRDGVRFWTMLAGQSLSGGIPLRQTVRWVRWSRSNRKRMVDPFFVAGDRSVGFEHLAGHLKSAVTNPRAFFGTYVRRGLDR